MAKVTDKELLEKLNTPETSGTQVTDPNLLEKLNEGTEEPGIIKRTATKIYDFFDGTKRTEYEDLPEIGSYKGEGLTSEQKRNIALGLNLTPNMKAQADIIKAQVPGATIVSDKFENPIVLFPDGKSFYLNKPGASFQDFIQTTSQILQYIPGASTALKKAGSGYVKRALYSGAAGGATSVAQDLATIPLGSKEGIDPVKLGASVVIPAGFEGVINPVGKNILRRIIGNPRFSSNGKLNERGKRAAKAAGLDVDNLDPNFLKEFAKELELGQDIEFATKSAQAGRFGIPLARSQATKDPEGFARLLEAKKGSYGSDVQSIANNFFNNQNIKIQEGAEDIARRFSKGQFETIDDAGEQIIKSIFNKAKKQDEKVSTLYNTIDKDAIFNAQESNIAVLPKNIESAIREKGTDIIDSQLTPNTIRAIQDVKNFVKKIRGTKKRKPVVKDLNDFENLRKKLNNYKVNAFGNPALKSDYKNLVSVVDEFDDFYDDALDNLLFSGDENALNIIKSARLENKIKNQLFGVRKIQSRGMKIDDKAGKVVVKILSDPDITPSETMNYIFGSSTLGAKQGSKEIIKRLKEIFGVEGTGAKFAKNSPDYQALRTGAFQKIIRDSIKQGKFSPETMSRLWDNAQKQSMPVLKELFDEKELKLIDEFIREVRKTFVPKDFANASNTASAFQRIMGGIGRGLAGIVGFKAASINGLITARIGYDRARDVASQKAAKHLVEQEFIRILPKPASPTLSAIETGTLLQNLTGDNIQAPIVPPSYLGR